MSAAAAVDTSHCVLCWVDFSDVWCKQHLGVVTSWRAQLRWLVQQCVHAQQQLGPCSSKHSHKKQYMNTTG
jgi:hypothetical protein